MLHQTLPILGQLWQLFEVSQLLEFLRYIKFCEGQGAVRLAILYTDRSCLAKHSLQSVQKPLCSEMNSEDLDLGLHI